MGRLDEIRARLEAAPPAPWIYGGGDNRFVVVYTHDYGSEGRLRITVEASTGARTAATADLIAHAPEDIRLLLDVARSLSEYRRITHTEPVNWKRAIAQCEQLYAALDALEANRG